MISNFTVFLFLFTINTSQKLALIYVSFWKFHQNSRSRSLLPICFLKTCVRKLPLLIQVDTQLSSKPSFPTQKCLEYPFYLRHFVFIEYFLLVWIWRSSLLIELQKFWFRLAAFPGSTLDQLLVGDLPSCHWGIKDIPVPYTNFSKKYAWPYIFILKPWNRCR